MRIHSKLVYQWCDRLDKYILVEDVWRPFSGQIAYCKGAGSQLTSIANSQQSFMNTLQQDFGTAFGNQQSILNNLTNSLTSTLQGGPSQYGFSAPETSALNTLATTQNAANYQNAKQAAGAAAAAANGGNVVLPSNAAAQTQANIASQAAQNQSNALLGIKEAGYQQGNQNYNNAVSGLLGVSGQENPTGLAGAANSAGNAAANTANQVQQLNNAASPWNTIGGILGGIAGTALGVATGGLSTAAGGISSGILGSLGGPSITGGVYGNAGAPNMGINFGNYGNGTLPNLPVPQLPTVTQG